MSDSIRLEIEGLRLELRLIEGRMEDLERQMIRCMERVKLLQNPSMPHRRYPPQLDRSPNG